MINMKKIECLFLIIVTLTYGKSSSSKSSVKPYSFKNAFPFMASSLETSFVLSTSIFPLFNVFSMDIFLEFRLIN